MIVVAMKGCNEDNDDAIVMITAQSWSASITQRRFNSYANEWVLGEASEGLFLVARTAKECEEGDFPPRT